MLGVQGSRYTPFVTVPGAATRTSGRIDAGSAALIVALVLLPLYPKVGLIAVRGTYVPVRLDDFITLGVIAAWGITLVRARRLPRVPSIAPFVLAWLAAGLVALAIGAALLGTVSLDTGFLFWAKPIEYLALGWAAYDLLDSPERLRLAILAIFITAAVVLMYAMLERFHWVPPAPNYATDVTARRGVLGSTMGDQHQMASYLGIVTLLGIAMWQRYPGAVRITGILALAVTAYVVLHAGGRSEFFSLAICSLLLAAWRPARAPALAMVGFLAIAFLLPAPVERALDGQLGNRSGSQTVVLPTPGPSTQPGGGSPEPSSSAPPIDVSDRIDDLPDDRSLEIRFRERWPVFIQTALRNPLLGAGPSAATEAADGYYIRSFTEIGVIGTLIFGALILSVVVALQRVFRWADGTARAGAIGLMAGTLFVGLVGVLIDTWVASRVMQLYWPAVGTILAAGQLAGVPSGMRSLRPSLDARRT